MTAAATPAQLSDVGTGQLPAQLRTLHHGALWLIEPDLLATPAYAERRRVLETIASSDAILARLAAVEEKGPAPVDVLAVQDGVGIVSVTGLLTKQPSLYRLLGCSEEATYPEITDGVRRAAAHPGVYSILLRVASPGGEAFGCPETADAVWAARQAGKRVVTYFEDVGCSAAVWIGLQARETVTNQIGHVGSIGVFCMLVDSSRAAEAAGLKFVPIASTPGKVGNRHGVPLDDATIAEQQQKIDKIGALFVRAVARGRGVSLADAERWHDARIHIGDDAVTAGLVDRVAPVDEVFTELVRYGQDKKKRMERAARIT